MGLSFTPSFPQQPRVQGSDLEVQPSCPNSSSSKDLICFLKTMGPETSKAGAEAERALFPLEYTGPTRSPPCLPKKDTCSPPPPHSAWQCFLHSLMWTPLLSDLLSNCYFVMSCVSLLKKRAESNLGAGSISFLFLSSFSGPGQGAGSCRQGPVRLGREESWFPAQNERVMAYSLLGLGGGQMEYLVDRSHRGSTRPG